MKTEPELRTARLRAAMDAAGVDTYFSVSPPDNQYLTGFVTDFGEISAAILLTQDEAIFLTDSRYTEQAESEVKGYAVELMRGDLIERAGERLSDLNAMRVAYDPTAVTVDAFRRIQSKFAGEWVPHKTLVKDLRERKSAAEIALIRAASNLAEGVMNDLIPEIHPGAEERALAARFEFEFKKRGALGPSFDTIALFGSRSSLPHGIPGPRVLESGDIILLDFGCRREGYCSDLTRTFACDTIPAAWFEDIYNIVLEAQLAALAEVKPGAACRAVDAAARDIIARRGYGDYFGHGVGHGVGIEIHEAPRVNPHSEAILEEGMVVTIEPGIYLPGKGGVRIEDLVVVTPDGCDNLSPSPKALKVLSP